MKLLIVEDEPKVVDFLKQGLGELGFEVDVAFDGQLGERMAMNNAYDIIILDVVLPAVNGYELCKRIRSKNESVPIIMLTALGTTDDKVTGFESGADDYLVKPFEFRELVARLNALTKRTRVIQEPKNYITVSDLSLDQNKKCAYRGDTTIELTAKEYSLLEFLMLNKGRILSRSEIAERVWDITFDTGTNVVDVYINILRKKIDSNFENKLIRTRIGLGYFIDNQ